MRKICHGGWLRVTRINIQRAAYHCLPLFYTRMPRERPDFDSLDAHRVDAVQCGDGGLVRVAGHPRLDRTDNVSESSRAVDEALIRRIEATVSDVGVSRSAVEFDWPECHRKNCQQRHGSADSAFTTFKIQTMRAIRSELAHEVTTRPDIAEDGDTEEQTAVYVLATLMNRYNVHDAGTFVRAARLVVDAYPAIIPVLGENERN